ncbi:3-hydroxyacyl-ACP dehydratase [uncultured Streptococcus sp.]|nr:3-hydroxyacyl-ACP dehydratase [uncultured Streptococcus sp.]
MDIITMFDRIEDILGCADGRYFSTRYTQVKYFQKVKHIAFD